MAKKNIILTESQMIRLQKSIIEDRRFENQELVDTLLDKINEFGIESLSDEELEILKEPNKKIVEPKNKLEFDDFVADNKIISNLVNTGLVSKEDLMILDENSYQLSSLTDDEGYLFSFFKDGNKLKLSTSVDGEDALMVESIGEPEMEEKMEVMEFIKEVWEDRLGVSVYCDGIDF